MNNKINLLAPDAGLDNGSGDHPLELMVLGENQQPVLMFTAIPQAIKLHYLDGGEHQGYNACNGPACVACMAGRKVEKKLLLPVYDPLSRAIAVLPIPSNRRPHALLPQLVNVLSGAKPAITLITNLGMGKFHVESRPLPADADGGEHLIAPFMKKYDADEIVLSTLYPSVTNEELRADGTIRKILELKGISVANS